MQISCFVLHGSCRILWVVWILSTSKAISSLLQEAVNYEGVATMLPHKISEKTSRRFPTKFAPISESTKTIALWNIQKATIARTVHRYSHRKPVVLFRKQPSLRKLFKSRGEKEAHSSGWKTKRARRTSNIFAFAFRSSHADQLQKLSLNHSNINDGALNDSASLINKLWFFEALTIANPQINQKAQNVCKTLVPLYNRLPNFRNRGFNISQI